MEKNNDKQTTSFDKLVDESVSFERSKAYFEKETGHQLRPELLLEKQKEAQYRWENGGKEIYEKLLENPNFINLEEYKGYFKNLALNKNTEDLTSLLSSTILSVEKNKANIIRTRYTDFDNRFELFKLGELIAIGGRPGLGKTQLLINLALNISISSPVLYLSYDLNKEALIKRFVSSLSKVGMNEIDEFIKNDKEGMKNVEAQLDKRKIFVNDIDFIHGLKSYFTQQVALNGVKVIIIDNFERLARAEEHPLNPKDNAITKELKQIAKELNICIVLTTRLSRYVEYRGGDRRPQLHDVPGEESIEMYANKIMLVYRPVHYGFTMDEKDEDCRSTLEIIIVKNKDGEMGTVRLKNDLGFMNIEEF